MKKLYTLSFILLASLSFGQTSIPFTGTGELTANGWVVTGTPISPATDFPGHLQIIETPSDSGNSLSYTGLAASTGNRTTITHNNTQDCNFALGTPLTGVAYYSLLIKASNTTGMFANTVTAGEYFLHFAASAGTTAGTFSGRLYVKQGSDVNTFTLGILNNSGGTATPTFTGANYAVSTTYFVVVKYVIATNTASLFVNPVATAAEPVANATNATGTGTTTQIGAIAIRQSGSTTATTSTGNIEIDEIRVGGTWADVTSGVPLGVKQNSISGLNVYPNPVTDGILKITSDSSNAKTVAVYDILGKQVINTKTSNNAVNVANLKSGAYIVKVTEDGKTDTRKLIIQ